MRVLVCDDHALFREGLRLLLEELDPTIDILLAGTAEGAVQLAEGGIDLVLLDWHLEGLTGEAALAALREALPLAQIVVLSGERDPRLVRSIVELGAAGFISKASSKEELMLALRTVAGGGIYLPASVLPPAANAQAQPRPVDVSELFPALTGRQADVLRATLRGLSNKLIARELGISPDTVKTHLKAIYGELGVQSRGEAVYLAARRGVKIF
jgi:two-component system nitrate/nitrite response regulator NarL